MNKLFIFLIIIIVCAIISKYFLVKEPFSPNTLRGMENNYSVTKMKNKFNNQVTNKVKGKFEGLQNYLQKMYNKWL
jgi:hypothetical protein